VWVDDGNVTLQYEYAKDSLDLKLFEFKENPTEAKTNGAK
jgi:hypothetical protein